MSIITKIEPQKSQRRVNIYLNGEFAFGADLETFVKLKLKVGQEYSEKEIENITKKAEFQTVLNKILRFVTLRPRSEKEIRDWLKNKKITENIHEDLFNRLKRLKLCNDAVFAKWWVGQRLQFKNRSIREIANELYKKGIDRKIIEKVLKESNIDEENSAKKLLEKRAFAWGKYKGYVKKKKMSEYLARKGFAWDVIKKVVSN